MNYDAGYGSGQAQPEFGAPRSGFQNQGFPQSNPPPSYGTYASGGGNQGGYGGNYLRGNEAQQNQIEEFGGESRNPGPITPSKPQGSAIAAGLTRPTNVV
jgi:hypothetical protein